MCATKVCGKSRQLFEWAFLFLSSFIRKLWTGWHNNLRKSLPFLACNDQFWVCCALRKTRFFLMTHSKIKRVWIISTYKSYFSNLNTSSWLRIVHLEQRFYKGVSLTTLQRRISISYRIGVLKQQAFPRFCLGKPLPLFGIVCFYPGKLMSV